MGEHNKSGPIRINFLHLAKSETYSNFLHLRKSGFIQGTKRFNVSGAVKYDLRGNPILKMPEKRITKEKTKITKGNRYP